MCHSAKKSPSVSLELLAQDTVGFRFSRVDAVVSKPVSKQDKPYKGIKYWLAPEQI